MIFITQSLSVNVALASPLLSRFDLVLVLRDSHNEEWDQLVSSFILSTKATPGTSTILEIDLSFGLCSVPEGMAPGQDEVWNVDRMQAYFSHVKGLRPTMSSDANRC